MAHHQGGLAPAPARLGASGPRHTLRPCRHIAVAHFADLPPLHQAIERTADWGARRTAGVVGPLAHALGQQARPLLLFLAWRPAHAVVARVAHGPGGPGALSAIPSPQSGALPHGKTLRR